MQGTELGLAQTFEQTDNLDIPDNTINNNFQDIEAFLERVLVQNPVSIDAELVPPVLSRGLGLNNDSSSVGQQGSNDRKVNSGKPWSSVSNDAQGATGNNNVVAKATNKFNTASDKGRNLHGKHILDETDAILSTKVHKIDNNGIEHRVMSLEEENARKIPTGVSPKGRWASPKADDGMKGTSKKRVHGHRNKSQKQMQWNQDLQQQLTRQQMQQQMQQMQQQQMQQQLQQMQQQYNATGASQPPFGLIPSPGYLFASQQQPFTHVPYPFQMAAPDGRRVGMYPGMEQPTGDQVTEDHAMKRTRLIWTDALHRRFLEAVERCGGIERALPKAIMKDMKVEGLTRENVSSHLQKYRLRLRKSAEKSECNDDDDDNDGDKTGE